MQEGVDQDQEMEEFLFPRIETKNLDRVCPIFSAVPENDNWTSAESCG